MPNQEFTAKSYVGGDPTGGDGAVQMDFTIKINADGNLGPLTATDPQGNKYVVSLKINTPGGPMCCCADGTGKIVCVSSKDCNCEPV